MAAYLADPLAVPATHWHHFSRVAENKPIQLFVASENALKVEAAKNAFLKLLPEAESRLTVKGFNAASGVDEQPVNTITIKGAESRLLHLKTLAEKSVNPDAIPVYVSMENGIFLEDVKDIKNPEKFKAADGVWVDRCYVIVEIAHSHLISKGTAYSRGVPVPLIAVKASEEAKHEKTCGSFIEKEFGFNAKDWHGQMASVGRKELMVDAIQAALEQIK